METFPSYVKLMAEGYSQRRESALSRTEMESGPAKQLKKLSKVMVTINFTGKVTQADLANFMIWFQTNINYGADWFNWTDPSDSVTKLGRIVSGVDSEEPETSRLDDWKIRFKLEHWSA